MWHDLVRRIVEFFKPKPYDWERYEQDLINAGVPPDRAKADRFVEQHDAAYHD